MKKIPGQTKVDETNHSAEYKLPLAPQASTRLKHLGYRGSIVLLLVSIHNYTAILDDLNSVDFYRQLIFDVQDPIRRTGMTNYSKSDNPTYFNKAADGGKCFQNTYLTCTFIRNLSVGLIKAL